MALRVENCIVTSPALSMTNENIRRVEPLAATHTLPIQIAHPTLLTRSFGSMPTPHWNSCNDRLDPGRQNRDAAACGESSSEVLPCPRPGRRSVRRSTEQAGTAASTVRPASGRMKTRGGSSPSGFGTSPTKAPTGSNNLDELWNLAAPIAEIERFRVRTGSRNPQSSTNDAGLAKSPQRHRQPALANSTAGLARMSTADLAAMAACIPAFSQDL